jgi:hypothetical protein
MKGVFFIQGLGSEASRYTTGRATVFSVFFFQARIGVYYNCMYHDGVLRLLSLFPLLVEVLDLDAIKLGHGFPRGFWLVFCTYRTGTRFDVLFFIFPSLPSWCLLGISGWVDR